jgi:hypothetical protein
VPASLIQQQRRMAAGGDVLGKQGKLVGHGFGVAPGHDQASRFAVLWADGAEDVGRRRALVMRRRGPASALGPASADLVLLPDPGLVAEPHLYGRALDALLARDRVQNGGETFLKSSIAPGRCA